jgi:hypothetical protein
MITFDSSRRDVVATALHERLRQLQADLDRPATSRAAHQYRRTVPNRIRLVESLLAHHGRAHMTPEQLLIDLDRLLEGSSRGKLLIAVEPTLPEVMHEAAQVDRILRAHMG